MRIRFTKPTKLTFITGVDEITNEILTEEEEFAVDEELECLVEYDNIGGTSIHAMWGIADKVPADNFQYLKLD